MTDDKPDKSGNPMQSEKTADKADIRMKSSSGSARLGRDVQNKIGQQLRAMYDDVVKEGVPDKFRDMLRQLDSPDDGSNEGSRG
jgi:predicted NAD-dependent protein-ADP-ribosyltransferase YbiA (DUF1768 family)